MKFVTERLGKHHNRQEFSCGEVLLERYFQQQVTQDIKRRITSCFVIAQDATIAGFYTISSSSIPIMDLPEEITKKLPRYPLLPALRIGRLAVNKIFQKQGIGSMLLVDAMHRALQAEAANFTLLVDAKNDNAVRFYKHHGFISLASQPQTLFLPLATAEQLLK